MSIYSKNHTYLGNADKICRFIGRKYKSQFWPNISSRYISLYLWIYVPLTYLGNNNKICRYISLYITQEKWAKNLVDFFLISCQWNRREKWAKNLVDFFQISCGFSHFSTRNWRKKISHSFFSTIFVGFLDKNCRFIAYKSTILVQETNKYR